MADDGTVVLWAAVAGCVVGVGLVLLVALRCTRCCNDNSCDGWRRAGVKNKQQGQRRGSRGSRGPSLIEEGRHHEMAPLRIDTTPAPSSPTNAATTNATTTNATTKSIAATPIAPAATPRPEDTATRPHDPQSHDARRSGNLHKRELSPGVLERLTASTRKLLEDAEQEFGTIDAADLVQEEAIGNGAQATVYAGTLHDREYRGQITKVAIKAYSGLALSNKQMTRDLMAELNALKALNQFKHTLHFYGIVLCEDELKTVLEWCRGTIDKLTEGYPMHRKLHLLAQAASAVHYLHSQHPPVMHGDIKPENILISENFQVRVADFATSRILDSARTSLTESRIRGTPVYMPPEAFNSKRIGLEGDIYAFAVTAWEVLTEQKAWHGLKMGRIMMAVSDGQRPDVQTLPTQIQLLLGDSWRNHPHERLASASLWTRSLTLAVLSALDNAVLLGGQSGGLQLLERIGSDDDTATAAERCIFLSVGAAVVQRGAQPNIPRFLSSLLGFFDAEQSVSIDESSQIESGLAELFGIVV